MLEKLLLVEGDFDKYFIEALLQQRPNQAGKITIEPFKRKSSTGKVDEQGIQTLLKHLPLTIKATYPGSTLGIVVDADISATGRWQRIRQILSDAGYENLPDRFPDGLIHSGSKALPRFGLWIMPDNSEEGVIENFIRQLIHEDDKLQPEVEAALNTVQAKQLQLFTNTHRPKAFIRTWLAWQERPEISFSVAIAQRILTVDAALGQRFVSWVNRLFVHQ